MELYIITADARFLPTRSLDQWERLERQRPGALQVASGLGAREEA